MCLRTNELALSKRRLNLLGHVYRRENHDVHGRLSFSDLAGRGETIHQPHPHVEQDAVGIDGDG